MGRNSSLQAAPSLKDKFLHMNWGLIGLLILLGCIGVTAQYSAANGHFNIWAHKQAIQFCAGLVGMIVVAMIDIRIWHRLAYFIFGVGLLALIAVEIMGHIGMGAQRWINLGIIKLQPSEFMKVAVVLALARYFHTATEDKIRRLMFLGLPIAITALPVIAVMSQPDLGTALMIIFAAAAMFFIAGAPLWLFIGGGALALAAIPIGWHFLHDYQRGRVLTFLNPERDPLGAGYHIIQSKIALGSGGLGGKGFLQGSQSHLNFLPEKQTDFIFTLWAEEWGFLGGMFLIGIFALIFIYCGWIAFNCRHDFGRYLAFGLMFNFFLYVCINIAMVMGLLPVVGVPLPMISLGGSAMLATMGSFGLIMSCSLHYDSKVPRI